VVIDPPDAVAFIIDNFEGKIFTEDPVDTGGATKFGITRRTLQYYRRLVTGDPSLIVTRDDVRNLTREEAILCGVDVFVTEPGIARLRDWRVRFTTIDYAFHSGWVPAIRSLQLSIGATPVDGVIGPLTLIAANKADPWATAVRVVSRRERLMQELIANKPSQSKYALGWWRRTTTVQEIIAL
jgi:peptidoglycan L-alanyl-D-glutamate endopeptidase CwlK